MVVAIYKKHRDEYKFEVRQNDETMAIASSTSRVEAARQALDYALDLLLAGPVTVQETKH